MPKQRGAWSTYPLLKQEVALWRAGFEAVAGVDEAGRGPLAGPVVAAACILPKMTVFPQVYDSKAIKEEQRNAIARELMARSDIFWAVGVVSEQKIDQINILQATLLAMKQALEALTPQPDFLLIDGKDYPAYGVPKMTLIQGDQLSQSIAFASIVAKYTRDALMLEHHQAYPQYGFDRHKGYGTKMHLEAIRKHGPCPLHRRSFAPVKQQISVNTS
jgi:ribonuclease HII